jgi:hypothetical protein
MHWLLVTANVPSSLILVTVMMETLSSSETSVLTRATQRNIPEDGIPDFTFVLHSPLKSIKLRFHCNEMLIDLDL